jgi:hypothetical protein
LFLSPWCGSIHMQWLPRLTGRQTNKKIVQLSSQKPNKASFGFHVTSLTKCPERIHAEET